MNEQEHIEVSIQDEAGKVQLKGNVPKELVQSVLDNRSWMVTSSQRQAKATRIVTRYRSFLESALVLSALISSIGFLFNGCGSNQPPSQLNNNQLYQQH